MNLCYIRLAAACLPFLLSSCGSDAERLQKLRSAASEAQSLADGHEAAAEDAEKRLAAMAAAPKAAPVTDPGGEIEKIRRVHSALDAEKKKLEDFIAAWEAQPKP